MKYYFDLFCENLGFFTFLLALCGGLFALVQWGQQVKQHRVEKVKELINITRDADDVAMIMDIIDWNNEFQYDGKFFLTEKSPFHMDSDTLFKKLDKTLSHFSYVCYLKAIHVFTNKDMAIFEYDLHRIIDNYHVANYLFSIYHWSHSLHVKCSFHYLINYSLKKKYLDKNFKKRSCNSKYKCFLKMP